MRVSLIQLNSSTDREANLAQAKALMTKAMERDRPDLIVLPETMTWIGGTKEQRLAAGQPFPENDGYQLCKHFAAENAVNVHCGSVTEAIPGQTRNRNTSVVFNRSGTEIARYAKIHMFDVAAPDGTAYLESDAFEPGSDVVTAEIDGTTFGLSICYDLRFPELFTALVGAGARAIFLPAAFTLQTGKDHWEVLCRARAIETQCWVLACGQFGNAPGPDGRPRASYGHSMIIDPWGHVVARASDGIGFVTASLDFTMVDSVRRRMPVSAHRRLVPAPFSVAAE
ncbi:MAG: carbon-nitrogen hydrolase family protein [Pseudomonadota bacterium]